MAGANEPGATPAGQEPGATPAAADPQEGATPAGGEDPKALLEALRKERESAKHWKAEAAKNAGAADRLAQAEEAGKSELQRALDQAAQAEARAKSAEGRIARLEVAQAKGIPPSLAARLVGDSREELEADADELAAQLRPQGGQPGAGGAGDKSRPREALRSGTAPQAEPEENDPTKLAAMVPRPY